MATSLLAALVLYAATGCASTEQVRQANLEDPQRAFVINVNSVPSGADVYAVGSSSAGAYLGKTPLQLRYAQVPGAGPTYYGQAASQTLVIESKGALPWDLGAWETLDFTCLVTKEGFHPFRMRERLAQSSGTLSTGGMSTGGKQYSFTALMTPVRTEAAPLEPPQQQQQQQQQTVLIPPPVQSDQDRFGTVMVSSNADEAELWIDGAFVGNLPATLRLAEGIHTVEVKKQGFKAFKREVRVFTGSEATVRANLDQ